VGISFKHLKNEIECALSAAEQAEGENKRLLVQRMQWLLFRADQALLIEGKQTLGPQDHTWSSLRSLPLDDGEAQPADA
jgi:hypothetical protein